MTAGEDLERVEAASAEALWTWLGDRHGQEASVWLVTYKKTAGERYVSREAVLDALIAYGWIDGVRRKLDAARTMQLISPRRQQAWAESYKRRAERLEAEGRMQPPGRDAIARSKALGLWDAMADVDALEIPEDLADALSAAPAARAWFEAAAPSYRRNVLRWIAGAKRPETRAKRLAQAAAFSARGEKIPNL